MASSAVYVSMVKPMVAQEQYADVHIEISAFLIMKVVIFGLWLTMSHVYYLESSHDTPFTFLSL